MLQYLKPKNAGLKKIRLGPNEDGGYVMPEFVLENCTALFAYGVGDYIQYESEFLSKYKKPVYTFDHTINWSPPEELNFTKEGLGFFENCNDFIVHYTQRNIIGEVFLKVDIEGAEYHYFNSVDHNKLSDIVMGICLEVHWLQLENYRQDFLNIMEKLEKNFTLIHIHANNNGSYFTFNDENVCGVLELSMINNKYIKNLEGKPEKYPIEGLDFPNNPQRPDPILNIFN